jgi:hypothetical protein
MNHAFERKTVVAEQLAIASDILYTEEVAALTRVPVATLRWLKATGQPPKCGKLGPASGKAQRERRIKINHDSGSSCRMV